MLSTLTDEEAVHMALLLSQQEAEFGVNMYDSLRPADERELQSLTGMGYTNEQAVLFIFEKRFPPRNSTSQPPPPAYQQAPRIIEPEHGARSGAPQRQASMMVSPPNPSPAVSGPGGVPLVAVAAEAVPVADGDDDGTVVHVQAEVALGVSRPSGGTTSALTSPVPPVPVPVSGPVQTPAPAPAMAPPPHAAAPLPAPGRPLVRGSPSQQVLAANGRVMVPPPSAAGSSRPAPGPGPGPNSGPTPARSSEHARTSSVASMASTTSNAAAPSGEKPKLVKKRSIFNFVSGGGGASEEPRERLKYKEADVRVITKMGYSKDQAVWALLQSHNNVPHAIDLLCNS